MNADLRQLKAELRREARRIRAGLDPQWRAKASRAICAGILELPEIKNPETRHIAVFSSFGDEIDTRPLLEELIRAKGGVLLPRVTGKQLEFRRVADLNRGMQPAYKGILEPEPAVWPETVEPDAMDLIVVPGLIYDRRGYRIGYGGGFYDALLAEPRRCRAIGIVFSPLLRPASLPISPHDRPVDAIQTEETLWITEG